MTQRNSKQLPLMAADLFAGGGGLTVGLKEAGFQVVGAVEIESHAFSTYKANHPEVHGFKQDIRTLSGADLLRLSPTGKIDLLAGCPPCQGFSSLTSKYRRNDPRNELVREMTRLVREIRPRAVMMENVPGLALKGKSLLDEFLEELKSLQYVPTSDVLQVADYGVPQSRRRLVVLAGHKFEIALPKATHSREGDDECESWRTVGDVIKGMPMPVTLKASRKKGGPEAHDWHVVRTLSVENQRRMKHAQPGKSWRKIPKRLRPECHQDKEAGFSNAYGRMSWNDVSPTITAGCTTFSKGRFGHPTQKRTISVREAALLQTFPSEYVFDTPFMEYACSIVGNALPCDFAEVFARQCASAIQKHDVKLQ